MLKIALQLYSVRDHTKEDFAGTLGKLRKIGYTAVELAGFGNLKTAAEVKKALDDNGMSLVGAHVGIDAFTKDLEKTLADHRTLGNTALIVPWIGEALRADYSATGKVLAEIAAKVKPAGFSLAYHNHSFEFSPTGKHGLDALFAAATGVNAELDVFWVAHGNVDPVKYIGQYAGRVSHLHLKDMSKADRNKFAPIGTGSLDFKAIVAAGVKAGAKFGVIEQDDSYGTPTLETSKVSLENLKALGLA